MPDQNNLNLPTEASAKAGQNPDPQVFPEDTNIPPIPSGMAQDTSFPNPIQTITDAPPQEVNTPPKKKFGGRKMIATILGLVVLIGGIAAGIVLVKQQQDIREKAGCTSNITCRTDCGLPYRCMADTCGGPDICCDATAACPGGGTNCPPAQNCGAPLCGLPSFTVSDGSCGTRTCPATTACPLPTMNANTVEPGWCIDHTGECVSYTTLGDRSVACKSPITSCSRANPTPTPTPMPGYVGCGEPCNDYVHCVSSLNCPGGPSGGHCVNGLCPNDPDCVCGTSTSTPTPTPTLGINAVCSAVKAYDINWNLLTGTQLSTLSAGDVVRFTVSGIPANQIDKARFTINGVLKPETANKKPGTNEYYIEYTIPAGVSSFTVTAQIHHATLGWF